MKKAQGLQISTIILAVLGLIVLVILIGLLSGKINLFSKNLRDATDQKCVDLAKSDTKNKYVVDDAGTCKNPVFGNFVDVPTGMVCCKSDAGA